jgi:hypothetical protein
MSDQSTDLVPFTIVIEWENAIDVEDEWAFRAVAGLERELEATAPLVQAKPVVSYLFNSEAVNPDVIRHAIAKAGPRLGDYARVDLVPTKGLSYYELKNFGAARADTEVSIFLDSDAAPQPGWLRTMVAPFTDPSVMAVGGITVLAYEDLLSRTLALTWIFGLVEESQETARNWGIYANNTAVRTAFFRDHPFPKLNAFKYSCVFWLRGILAQNFRYVRVAEAVTIHAPHPNFRFFFWRAWTTGLDRDFYVSQTRTPSRVGRTLRAGGFFLSKTVRAWWRIITKRHSVGLPLWQAPAAMALAFGYSVALFAGQLWSIMSRRHAVTPDQTVAVSGSPTTS